MNVENVCSLSSFKITFLDYSETFCSFSVLQCVQENICSVLQKGSEGI